MSKKKILAHEYTYYNANARGTSAPDCVCRSISLAFDKPYSKILQELNAAYKKYGRGWPSYKHHHIYSHVIEDNGGSSGKMTDTPHPTLGEFCDANPSGTFIVQTGDPKKNTNGVGNSTNHLVCVVDGTIYDSWDSSNQYAVRYYVVEGSVKINKEDPVSNHLDELNKEAIELFTKWASQYMDKYNFPSGRSIELDAVYKHGFRLKYAFTFSAMTIPGKRYRKSFEIPLVFTPTDTLDTAREKMQKAIKQKLYDQFWSINKAYQDKLEEHKLAEELGTKDYAATHYLNGYESRFYKSLPGWVKPYVKYINIWQPGQYSDSCLLKIQSLPGDPDPDNVVFEWYDTTTIKDMLRRYKESYARPYDSYDPYEDYIV